MDLQPIECCPCAQTRLAVLRLIVPPPTSPLITSSISQALMEYFDASPFYNRSLDVTSNAGHVITKMEDIEMIHRVMVSGNQHPTRKAHLNPKPRTPVVSDIDYQTPFPFRVSATIALPRHDNSMTTLKVVQKKKGVVTCGRTHVNV